MSNIIQTSSKQIMKCRVHDLIQQLSGHALGHADSNRGRLEYLGQRWMKSSKWTLQKVAFFLFCKMFVSHRHQHRRLPEKHLSASPCLIQQCKRLPIQFSSDKLWILKSWKEKWKLIRKKPWTAYLFFIWWSKSQWDEQNSISLSCLFFLSWLPCFFLLKKNKNKIYIHIYLSEFNKLQKPTFLVCFFSLGNYFMQWCMICHIDVDQCHSPWTID